MGWCRRLHRTITGSAAVDEFDEECAFHLEQYIAEAVNRGLTAEDARREARQRLGNLSLARDQTHDADTVRWLTDLGQDLRYAARSLRHAPVFTLTALAALTLGIGANTAMFAVVNTVLVKPPPYPDPARIVALGYTFQGIRAPLTSPAKFSVWRQGATALQEIAALRNRPVNLGDGGDAEQLQGMEVNTDFFTLLGARMAQGRAFTAEEDRPGGAPVVVLAHHFWQRRFGSAPDIVGRTISIDGGSAVIVGVMDAGFDTTIFNVSPDLWVPLLVANGVQRIGAVPGVVSAAATCCLPLLSDWGTSFVIVGRPSERRAAVTQVSYRIISSGYFDVLKIPLRRGRTFTERDHDGAPAVAVINRAMARQFWPSGDPLDDRLVAFPGLVPDDEPARQIVGIVDDVRDGMPLEREQRPTIYVPLSQLLDRENGGWSLVWLVRTRTTSYALTAAIEEQLRQVSGGLPVAGVKSMDDLAGQATAPTHFQMIVLALFAGAAVVLAVIGVYGVTAYTVQQRQHEIGIRMALGATRHQVRLLFLKEGARLALCGVLIGLMLAFGLTGFLETLLFGVTAHDRAVFITATVVLATVVLSAVWSPARRATLVDPIRWLRDE